MNIDLWQLKLHWPFLSQSFTICMCMYIILKHWISETTILQITLQEFTFFHSSHVLVLVFTVSQSHSPFLEAKLITQLFSYVLWILYNSPSTVDVCSIWISSCFFDLPPLFLWERWIWQKQKIFKNTYYYAIFRNFP